MCHAQARASLRRWSTNSRNMRVNSKQDYSIYIVTNSKRSVLYTGVTNNLCLRLIEHWVNKGNQRTFAGRYYCFNLIYFENFLYVNDAIAREKEIKGWDRKKKLQLIKTMNPTLTFLNALICDCWPPKEIPKRFWEIPFWTPWDASYLGMTGEVAAILFCSRHRPLRLSFFFPVIRSFLSTLLFSLNCFFCLSTLFSLSSLLFLSSLPFLSSRGTRDLMVQNTKMAYY